MKSYQHYYVTRRKPYKRYILFNIDFSISPLLVFDCFKLKKISNTVRNLAKDPISLFQKINYINSKIVIFDEAFWKMFPFIRQSKKNIYFLKINLLYKTRN